MNVLVLSSSDKVYSAVMKLHAVCGNHRAQRAQNVQQAKALIGQCVFGAAVIHADSMDIGFRDICLTLAENCVGTAFLPKGGSDELYELYDRGVLVAERPLTKATLYVALRAALGVAYRYEKLLRENADLKDRLETLRIVSRAKCILAYGGMTVEWGNGSVSWQDSETDQRKWLNEPGFTYYYVAILS